MFGLFLLIGVVNAEFFTSFVHMKKTFDTRQYMVDLVKEYVHAENTRLESIMNTVNDIESQSVQIGNVDDFLGNPINQLRLIKHLTIDLQKINELVADKTSSEKLLNAMKMSNLPEEEDMQGALVGIFRIQDTYALSPDFFTQGNSSAKHMAQPMSWRECFQLGRLAYSRKDYDHAYDWLRAAFGLLPSSESMNVTDKKDLIDHLAYVSHMIGLSDQALHLTNLYLESEPNHIRSQQNRDYFIREMENKGRSTADALSTNSTPVMREKSERNEYEQLCSGMTIMNDTSRTSKLHCSLFTNNKPSLLLQPVKLEVVFDKPRVVLFHDIISDKEIEFLENVSEGKLKRATVRSSTSNKFVPADYRVSESTWIADNFHPIVKRFSQLISDLTNLTMETAEELQVQNYGIGGHYEPHYDFSRKSEQNIFDHGNRVATWLTYMSEVEMGGDTVYPIVGAKLSPIKGSAAFWYNLYRSGSGDYSTRHASCPVLMGSKWVANKWIHEKGQEFSRPCAKDPML